MLKPLKSFLTYLQKNANGASNIFGLSPNMNSTDESALDQTEILTLVEPCNETDPIDDPLALDDTGITDLNTTTTTLDTSLTDLDTSTDGHIILVDVNALTKSDDNNQSSSCGSETELEDSFIVPVLSLDEIVKGEERNDGSDSGIGPEPILPVIEQHPVEKSFPTSTRSNLKRRSDALDLDEIQSKRPKRGITFDGVTVYYFPRIQGFTCIPSQGGCSLGMGPIHTNVKTFSLAEHAAEQRRYHRQQLHELNPRSSSSEDSDSDYEPSDNSESEMDGESYGFLQPVSTRQRRTMLKAAGVRKIDTSEKDECKEIRSSREFCGCTCRGYCDPDTCACSQSGIKCQVDRLNFPCGCTNRDGCGNIVGRVEFNSGRVRTHFIHTIMRLELEKKQNQSEEQLYEQQQHFLPAQHNNLLPPVPAPHNINYNTNYTNSLVNETIDLNYAFRGDFPCNENDSYQYNQYTNNYPEYQQSQFQAGPSNYQHSSYTSNNVTPTTLINYENISTNNLNFNNSTNSTETEQNETDFMTLQPPENNSKHLDDINDLLQNNRNLAISTPSTTNFLSDFSNCEKLENNSAEEQFQVENLSEIIKKQISDTFLV